MLCAFYLTPTLRTEQSSYTRSFEHVSTIINLNHLKPKEAKIRGFFVLTMDEMTRNKTAMLIKLFA